MNAERPLLRPASAERASARASPPRARSLAYRLAVAHAIALVLLCAAISYVLDNAVLRGLEYDLERAVESEARHVAALIGDRDDAEAALRDHLRLVFETQAQPQIVLRVTPPRGGTIAADPLAKGLAVPPPEEWMPDEWMYRREEARDARGRPYAIEVFGLSREAGRFVARFRWSLVALVTPLLAGAIVVAYAVVRRTLAPLERITAAAARVGSTTLGERIEVPRASDEIARLAGSFNAMLDRLEDAFTRLQDFGADLAHEIRTPIQNVRGQAEVALLNPRSPDEYREILAGMVEECARLGKIVDDVLLLSRVERHEEALVPAPFDLAGEIEGVREYFVDFAAARGVSLAARAARPLPVVGDRLKLRRAIANLVDNALKYTDAGGRVDLEARGDGGGGVEVVVTDTGKGIAPEHLPKLFERFYRVEKSRSREFGGAGLGLGIARTLVRAHGGDLTIESEVGKGTRARVRLPPG